MKKKWAWLLLVCLLLGQLNACGKEEETEEAAYQIYYINKDETAVVSEGFEPVSTTEEALVQEFIDKLQENPESTDCKRALPESVNLLNYTLENGQLYLYFDGGYQMMDRVYEVLCRAAIVRTVCQLQQVDYVAFFVNDQSLLDSNQMPVGLMSAELFIENAGEQINTYNSVTLDLFFANATGDKLLKERDTFNYSSNMSLEKLVVEQLIKGPVSDYAYPSIPPETKLLSVTTKDGVCYVNFDEGFMGQGYDVSEAVLIYSIVNSLAELQNVNKVQILVNGETPKVYRESISLETIFERDMDMVETVTEESEEETKGQEDAQDGEKTGDETDQEEKKETSQ